MDSAVGLVQTYLRVNGYFTVSEYPVVELRRSFQTVTDLDILAVRFHRAQRVIARESPSARTSHASFVVDPALGVPRGQTDMIVAEVKEGTAEFNRSGRRPEVISVALARFGCCGAGESSSVAERLLRVGITKTDGGHSIRLVAFGSTVGRSEVPYHRISLGHVVRFLRAWVADHWTVLRHTQSKDPVLSFLLTLAKAERGLPKSRSG